tara:strand:+ start:477 stop:827 length:351 start_codon:yes stop_codon:yes gene_type:complete
MNNINYDLNINYKITEKNTEYRKQLLDFFNLDDYDTNVIINKIDEIYDNIKDFRELNQYLKKITRFSYFKDDDHKGNMLLLFSYDYFEEFSFCLKDIVKYNKISVINHKKLLDIIN